MKLEIRKTSWFKRRVPTKEIEAVSVEIEDLKLIDNHKCTMKVVYDDGKTYELSGRVNLNDIKGTWTVAGNNPHGLMTMVDIIEESTH